MSWQVRPVSGAQARRFVCWRYAPPYDMYNIVADPGDEEAVAEAAAYFLRPDVHCHTIVDERGELLAFFTFGADARVPGGDYSVEALDIGLGVRPDLTGRGLGSHFVQAVLDFAQQTFAPPLLRVTIAEFNLRAQRVWALQNFAVTQHFVAHTPSQRPFLILTRKPA